MLLPVEGTLVLVVDGQAVPAPVGSPVRFAGETPVSVLVTGPGRALNLMVRRGDLRGDLVARHPGTEPVGHPAAVVELDGMIVDVHLSPTTATGATP